MMATVRTATGADVAAAVELGEKLFALSHWSDVTTFDGERFERTLSALIERNDAVVLLSPAGLLILIVVPLYFAPIDTVQELLFWSLDGTGDELRIAGEAWAADRGAVVPIIMGAHEPCDPEIMARWYRRAGYEPHGRTFRKVIANGH